MTIYKYTPSYTSIPTREVMRYMGMKNETSEITSKALSICDMLQKNSSPALCYTVIPVRIVQNTVTLGVVSFKSKSLSTHLKGSSKAVVFAATLGIGADRLISRLSHTSVADAHCADAAGTAYIESICDAFAQDLKTFDFCKNCHLTTRFSPGYGDVPLDLQKDIFSITDCAKNIGLTLSDSLLMMPTKSVTAIIGISDCELRGNNCSCSECNLNNCLYRKEE